MVVSCQLVSVKLTLVQNSHTSTLSLLLCKDHGPEWARGLNPEDYALVCPTQETSVPIDRFAECNLAHVPAHAVVTRPEIRSKVIQILKSQEVSKNVFSRCLFFNYTPNNGMVRAIKVVSCCILMVDLFLTNNEVYTV